MSRLSDIERRDWLRLIRTERIGPVTFYQLLERFGSAKATIEALPQRARLAVYEKERAEDELATVARLGGKLIGRFEPEYPPALAALDEAPPLLCVRGRTDLLAQRMVAVIGSRNASANGLRFAERLAADLGAAGLVVVSGLARGIDAAGHRGALTAGTVAVMAGGVDVVYPPENRRLYDEILAAGALVSEMPPGLVPRAKSFPRRNRIVSGLSMGVVVVEAALKSGSLITARLAGEQGRDVFAVPGSPLDPRARGTNDLIRNGATLVEGVEDVLRGLGHAVPAAPEPPAPRPTIALPNVNSALPAVLEKLSAAPTQVDEIIRRCHLPAALVHMALLELELAGRVARHPGNTVSTVETIG